MAVEAKIIQNNMCSIINHYFLPIRILTSIAAKFRWFVSDKTYLKLLFRKNMGYKLNLKDPQTFNEKLQWLKLYNRRPEYTTMVDKYAVKDYVANIIGQEYVIPTIGVWDKPEDIEREMLPNKFVLKTTHGGGNTGVVICYDKNNFNWEDAYKKLNESLKLDIYKRWGEWPYKNVPKRIIAEKYIEPKPNNNDLPDYKFFCFDGEVKAMFVATERQKPGEDVKFDFFDADYNNLPFRQGHDHANHLPPKPHNFDMMKTAAAKLSKNIPHVRVDFYEVGEKIYFGEMTFFHFSGTMPFEPNEWDKKFGDMILLPNEKHCI